MDREDVEYIERDDDEEFDEFGRKKKKRNKEVCYVCFLEVLTFNSGKVKCQHSSCRIKIRVIDGK